MNKTITKKWLNDNSACSSACDWIDKQDTRASSMALKINTPHEIAECPYKGYYKGNDLEGYCFNCRMKKKKVLSQDESNQNQKQAQNRMGAKKPPINP